MTTTDSIYAIDKSALVIPQGALDMVSRAEVGGSFDDDEKFFGASLLAT